MSVILQVKNLSKQFNLHTLNRKQINGCSNVSFELKEGQFLGIKGLSGTGKSTILKCIYRTYLPTEGQIIFNSKLVGPLDLVQADERQVLALRGREMGYVSQFLRVLPRVSALDVVAEGLVHLGKSREEAREEAARFLSRLQISTHLWDAYPATFSGGEQLRINLARSMVLRPRLLLLDEPTASLDPVTKGIVKQIILEIKASGTSMIGIFHDHDFMAQVADSIHQMTGSSLEVTA
ncbi:MAG: phosphonate C-P lyase system protein PhnL [Thermincolia bacterium]